MLGMAIAAVAGGVADEAVIAVAADAEVLMLSEMLMLLAALSFCSSLPPRRCPPPPPSLWLDEGFEVTAVNAEKRVSHPRAHDPTS